MESIDVFRIGTIPIMLASGAHAIGTLVDMFRPFMFTPRDLAFKEEMDRHQARITNRTTIWKAWLGFNLNFGLGVFVFGLMLLIISYQPGGEELVSTLRPIAITFSAILFISAIRFWFYAPAIATGAGFACFALSGLI